MNTDREEISFLLPAELIERLGQMAKSENISLNDMVERILMDAVSAIEKDLEKSQTD